MINAQVTSKPNENSMNLIRRFSRKINRSGVLRRVRTLKDYEREKSRNVRKQQAIRSLRKLEEVERLIKLGKLPDRRVEMMTIESDEDSQDSK